MVDRIAPTQRPQGPPQGFQRWQTLLFLHWEVPVSALRPLLPPELSIDTFEDHAYVGLVPFTMRGVRPLRILPAIPGTADFHETNVRTYVLHKGRDPGVWFFSLDAANRLAVFAARTFFHLPYHYADMELKQDGAALRYRSRRRTGDARLELQYTIGQELPPSEPGTLQFFLAERYLLYARDGHGQLFRGQVHHRPYPLHAATVQKLDQTLLRAAGLPDDGQRTPPLFSPGVDVEVFSLQRL